MKTRSSVQAQDLNPCTTPTFPVSRTEPWRHRAVFLLFCVIAPQAANAYDQPAVNLGATNFLDGALLVPGWYFQQYFVYYTAGRLNDNDGNKLALPRQHLDVTAGVTALTWMSANKLGGGRLGWDFALPWLVDSNADDGLGNSVLKTGSGFGDLFTGPFYQFDPIMDARGPRFMHRLALHFIVPTGHYDPNNEGNLGSNFWSFNPSWTATYWITPEWSASARLHYLWNAKNTDPYASFGPGVSSTQAGQAVHANLATEYAMTPWFRLGLNGYWFNQFTDTKVNGTDVPGRRERVWAIGPGALLSFSREDHFFANVYFEQDARNRPQGSRFWFRYVHQF